MYRSVDEMLWPEAHRNLTVHFPLEQWFGGVHEFSVCGDFIEYNHHK